MKLLFDQNLSFKLCRRLGDLFPDSNRPTAYVEQLLRRNYVAIEQFARDTTSGCLEIY